MHNVNNNVYVGMLRDDTPLWKYKAGLMLATHSLELFPFRQTENQ